MLLKRTLIKWQGDHISLWAAAIAFYTVFSLSPLVVLTITIAGIVFDRKTAQQQVVSQIQNLIGFQGAKAVEGIIDNAQQPGTGSLVATIFSLATLLLGASAVFNQLQAALNTIWKPDLRPRFNFKDFLQNRLVSFAMVLVIGFLLLVSLFISTALAAIANFFGSLFPGLTLFGQVLDIMFSVGATTLLFALIYKVLPDVEVAWSNLWAGAMVSACLFTLGKFLIGLYLGNSGISSSYGAAGSLIVILIWVYYSAQVLLIGSEFTYVYTHQYRSQIKRRNESYVRKN